MNDMPEKNKSLLVALFGILAFAAILAWSQTSSPDSTPSSSLALVQRYAPVTVALVQSGFYNSTIANRLYVVDNSRKALAASPILGNPATERARYVELHGTTAYVLFQTPQLFFPSPNATTVTPTIRVIDVTNPSFPVVSSAINSVTPIGTAVAPIPGIFYTFGDFHDMKLSPDGRFLVISATDAASFPMVQQYAIVIDLQNSNATSYILLNSFNGALSASFSLPWGSAIAITPDSSRAVISHYNPVSGQSGITVVRLDNSSVLGSLVNLSATIKRIETSNSKFYWLTNGGYIGAGSLSPTIGNLGTIIPFAGNVYDMTFDIGANRLGFSEIVTVGASNVKIVDTNNDTVICNFPAPPGTSLSATSLNSAGVLGYPSFVIRSFLIPSVTFFQNPGVAVFNSVTCTSGPSVQASSQLNQVFGFARGIFTTDGQQKYFAFPSAVFVAGQSLMLYLLQSANPNNVYPVALIPNSILGFTSVIDIAGAQ